MAEWLSRWPRDPRKRKNGCANDRIASGLRARRGSSPFPGATSRCALLEAKHGLFFFLAFFSVLMFAFFGDVVRHVNG